MKQVWETELSASDIKNGNIRFATTTLKIDADYVGGTNKHQPAIRRISVNFGSAPPTEQWLYGDKKIFAKRNPATKDFFAKIGAVPGTRIKVTMTAPNLMQIEKA